MIVVRVGSPQSLLVASFERTRDCRPALWGWRPTLGFCRMIDKVAMGPFGTARETGKKTRPGEDYKKRETGEKEDGCVEGKASVIETACLSPDGRRISRAGRDGIVRLVIKTRRHCNLAGLNTKGESCLRSLRRREKRKETSEYMPVGPPGL